MTNKRLVFCLTALVLLSTSASAAATSDAVDRGPLAAVEPTAPISFTVALPLLNLAEAEDLQRAIYTPGTAQYHRFLTASEFVQRFAPSDADTAKAIAGFAKFHLTAAKTSATTLKVSGLPADVQRAFSVNLHRYEVAAEGNKPGYAFHAPANTPLIPAELGVSIAGIAGLDNRPAAHPYIKRIPQAVRIAAQNAAAGQSSGSGNPPGYLTVTDFADRYDVQPLYKAGITGAGRTIGILTLAAFTPTDAFAYWNALNLSVDSNRINVVNVDGGPGAPSDASGSDETTLDVEQSGGVAPGAKILVYQAPNTSQGLIDVFAAGVEENKAESLSVSWGDWEWLFNKDNGLVKDPTTGKQVSQVRAIHELLLRAAIQGQSVFAASGDNGAYQATNAFACLPPYSSSNPNSCTLALSVDYPASDPLITAAGGTTLPGVYPLCVDQACDTTYTVQIRNESVWGWDYLNGWCKAIGYPDPISCGTFPAGSGGGVSVSFLEPFYQFGISGVELSQPGQIFETPANPTYGTPAINYALPAYFPGRNLPDISFNADPLTGYVLLYTSDKNGFGAIPGYGGTSFVAPQLNGVTALLGQSTGERLGLWNPLLYSIAATGQSYRGHNAPFNAIKTGDNWFYYGSNGYNLGAGLGTLDVANFAALLAMY